MQTRRLPLRPGVTGLLAGILMGLPVTAGAQAIPPIGHQSGAPQAQSTTQAPNPGQQVKDPPAEDTAAAGGDKRVGRALLEAGTFLTLSTLNYWRKYSDFIEDWQFELTWEDQRRKLFTSEGHRLDSNNMQLNWTHAAAGAIYYNWARTNRLSAGESTLVAAGASLIWEYVAEWREISSINDHIYTVAGGVAIGEPIFQIGQYFRNRPGTKHRIFETVSNPILAANDFLDGSRRPPRVPEDTDHDFRFAMGGRSGAVTADGRSPDAGALTLDMQVVTLPGYGEPGTGRGFARRVVDSALRFDLHAARGAPGEFAIRTRTTLFGWWWKHVRQEHEGRRRGYDLWLGAGTAWHIWQKNPIVAYDGKELGMVDRVMVRERPTRYADKSSFVNLPGPALTLTRYDGALRTRLDLQASVDFGMVNALAYNPYTARSDPAGVKTTLHNWGYYYAWGVSTAGRVELRYGPLRARAGIEHQRARSIQGLDRFQADVTDDTPLADSRLPYGVGFDVQIPRTPVFGSVGVYRLDRHGRFHDITESRHETRVGYQVGIRF